MEKQDTSSLKGRNIVKSAFSYFQKKDSQVEDLILSPEGESRPDVGVLIESSSYQTLPVDVVLEIFLYLDVISLCRVSGVCVAWSNLSNDEALWKEKLERNARRWEAIDCNSHPLLYKNAGLNFTTKEIYLHCCPEYRIKKKQKSTLVTSLSTLSFYLRNFSFVPKVIMFGSGLDSSSFVKKMLWDERCPFTVKGMFAGQFEGVGSGFTVQHNNGMLNLITLYSQPKAERESSSSVRDSKLLTTDARGNVTLSPPIKQLSRTVHAGIFVVRTATLSEVSRGIDELTAMVDNGCLPDQAPLLVLGLLASSSERGISSLDVANALKMVELTRPWQVRECHMDSFYGFMLGVTWLQREVTGA